MLREQAFLSKQDFGGVPGSSRPRSVLYSSRKFTCSLQAAKLHVCRCLSLCMPSMKAYAQGSTPALGC